MTRTPFDDFDCSIAQALHAVGDAWSVMIIRDLFMGVRRFSDFQKRLGIARNILADRLGHLVDVGIAERCQTKPGVERYEYELTEKGRSLLPVIAGLMQWGDKWIYGQKGEPIQIVDRDTGAPIQPVALQARDGRFLGPRDVRFAPGPNASDDVKDWFAESVS